MAVEAVAHVFPVGYPSINAVFIAELCFPCGQYRVSHRRTVDCIEVAVPLLYILINFAVSYAP